jgi:hypothetical protein
MFRVTRKSRRWYAGSRSALRSTIPFIWPLTCSIVTPGRSRPALVMTRRFCRAGFTTACSGIQISETHPIGVGPGQFEYVAPISAHSTYIRAGAEEGVLGLAALLSLLIGTLIVACRNVVLGRGTAGLSSTALLASWVGLLANSVFVDTLHWRHLWILAGLIWAGSLIPRPEETQASSSAGAFSPT